MIQTLLLSIIPFLVLLILPGIPFVIGIISDNTNSKITYFAIGLWLEIIVVGGYGRQI